MAKRGDKRVTNNIVMLYILNITQLALPLVTLPYLTRVLSVSGYGIVSYVKSLIIYATLIIEFGYLLSGTREVVNAKSDKQKLGLIMGRITEAKLLLSLVAFAALLGMIAVVPLLHRYPIFTILSFGTPFLSIFLFDYLFRGLERMEIITYRFLIMKSISTVLTFVLIHGDQQLLLIPLLDVLGSLVAIIWVWHEIRKMGIHIKFDRLVNVWDSLKVSFTYFISNVASTAFGALNTLFVGIYLSAADVAYWGLIMTMIGAVQSLYTPISDGIYPHMIATKSLCLLGRIVLLFTPLLVLGGIIAYFGAHLIMLIIGGSKYLIAAQYLRKCVPLLVISFYALIFGWPALGAIDKVRETTITTLVAAVLQVIGLFLLIISHHFTLPLLILVRTLTEAVMAGMRMGYLWRFRKLFVK